MARPPSGSQIGVSREGESRVFAHLQSDAAGWFEREHLDSGRHVLRMLGGPCELPAEEVAVSLPMASPLVIKGKTWPGGGG